MESNQINDDFDYEKIQAILEEEERNKRNRREEEKRRDEKLDKDRHRKKDRSRDNERSRGDRDRERDRSRDRRHPKRDSRDRRQSDRRSRTRSRDRHERRERERDKRNKEKVIMDRTIEEANAKERDLFNFFMSASIGKVVDIKVIRDPRTGRSKGAAYVEFETQESVMLAVAMSGQQVMGQAVTIQHSQAEKNRLAAAAKYKKEMIKEQYRVMPLELSESSDAAMKIYVGGLTEHLADIADSDLRSIFTPFGEIEFIDMPKDSVTGKLKGFCFIQYRKAAQAQAAISSMNGFKYKGKLLKVGISHEEVRNGNEIFPYTGDIDEDSHLHNSQSKQALMQKLNRDVPLDINQSLGIDYHHHSTTSPVNSGIPSVSQSNCVLLSNLFDPSTVNLREEPNFYKDTREDVFEECSNFGKVEDVVIEMNSTGNVWVKYANSNWQAARAALEGLNGRWFASRPIRAQLVSESVLEENIKKIKYS